MRKIYLLLPAGTFAFAGKRLRLVVALMFTMFFAQQSFGQILAWDFNGKLGSEATDPSTTTNANLATSNITKGSGLNDPAGANAFPGSFGAVGYSTSSTTLASAVTALEYLQ